MTKVSYHSKNVPNRKLGSSKDYVLQGYFFKRSNRNDKVLAIPIIHYIS